jgi:hypothetical protein
VTVQPIALYVAHETVVLPKVKNNMQVSCAVHKASGRAICDQEKEPRKRPSALIGIRRRLFSFLHEPARTEGYRHGEKNARRYLSAKEKAGHDAKNQEVPQTRARGFECPKRIGEVEKYQEAHPDIEIAVAAVHTMCEGHREQAGGDQAYCRTTKPLTHMIDQHNCAGSR